MSIIAVETAIQKIREVVKEWNDVELNYWREDQTRYSLIDPIIRALGWDTSNPSVTSLYPGNSRTTAILADF